MKEYVTMDTDFWNDPTVSEEMSSDERLFYLYLLMNQYKSTTEEGVYQITIKRIAFDLNFSVEYVHELMEQFIEHFKLISYNYETREVIIIDSGKYYVRV